MFLPDQSKTIDDHNFHVVKLFAGDYLVGKKFEKLYNEKTIKAFPSEKIKKRMRVH